MAGLDGAAIAGHIAALQAAQEASQALWERFCPPEEFSGLRLRLRAWPRDEAVHRRFMALKAAYQATPEFAAWQALRRQWTTAIERPLRRSFAVGAPDFAAALVILGARERAQGLCALRRWLLDQLRRMTLDPGLAAALQGLAFAAIERREFGHCRGEIVAYRRLLRGIAGAAEVAALRRLTADPSRYVADKATRALAVVLQGRPELRG